MAEGLNEDRSLDLWYSALCATGRRHLPRYAGLLCTLPCRTHPDGHSFHYPNPDRFGHTADFNFLSHANPVADSYIQPHQHSLHPVHAHPQPHPDAYANPEQNLDENSHTQQHSGKHSHSNPHANVHANAYWNQYSHINADTHAYRNGHGNCYQYIHSERDAHRI